MITYLISFILCSGLLLGVYQLLLSREHLLRFNRFYLLISLIFSLIVPVLRIPAWWKSPERPLIQQQQQVDQPEIIDPGNAPPAELETTIVAVKQFNWALAVQVLYAAVGVVLLARFGINLVRIIRKAGKATLVVMNNQPVLLTSEAEPPHSFFKYIFLREADYEADVIPAEVICHEQAHARQLHTADVLFIELLQALCWFNPFIPFYRRAIQLNHEYLADAAVIESYQDTVSYQYLILAMSGGGRQSAVALSSQFNYQTIKNRLVMITKTTSRTMAICRQMAVVPALAAAVLLFSQKSEAKIMMRGASPANSAGKQANPTVGLSKLREGTTDPKPHAIPEGMRPKHAATDASAAVMNEYAEILKKYNLSSTSGNTKDISDADKERMHTLFTQMSRSQQDAQWVRFWKADEPIPKSKVTDAQLKRWQKDAQTYGVWVDDKRIKNADLSNYTANDFDVMQYSGLTPVAVKNDGFRFQINMMTKAYYADYYKKTMANRDDQLRHIKHMAYKK